MANVFFFFFAFFSMREKDQVTRFTHTLTRLDAGGGSVVRVHLAALFSRFFFCFIVPLPLPFRLFQSILGDPF